MTRRLSSPSIWGVGILLLAFGLRVFTLAVRPIWYDDAFEIFLSEKDIPAILAGGAADTMPPLHYLLLHVWLALVGETPFALRFSSVALSMLVVALAFAVASSAFGKRAGALAALFVAVAPFQIYYAQDLRMYGLFAFAGLLYLLAVQQLSSDRRLAPLLVAASTALTLYSHNLAILTIVAGNVYFLLRRDWRKELKLIACQAAGIIAFSPWLLYLPGQLAKIQKAFWTQPPGIAEILQLLTMFTTHLPLPGILLAGALFVTLGVLAIAILEAVRLFRRGAVPALSLFASFALVPPVLMFIVSFLMRPVFVPRGVILSALAYYVLLAALAARASRVGQGIIIGVAFVIAATALPFYYTAWGEWRRAPFAEADQYLRRSMQADDLILHDNKLSFFPMHFYDRALPQQFLADPPGSGNDTLAHESQAAMNLFSIDMQEASQGKTHIWFVIFQTAIDEAAQDGQVQGNVARLDAAFRRESVRSFGDLRIYQYENP